MKRRDLIAGVAASLVSPAAPPPPEQATLYIPSAHRVEDLALMHDTMDEYPFVDLVTPSPELRITHLPVWLDRKSGPYGVLYGHIARHNPQSAALDGRTSATIVFRGPDAYISPSWYSNPKAVPTWNFAAVHASGKPLPLMAGPELYELLATLIARSEGKYAGGAYDFKSLPRDYVDGMMQAIVGFKMPIELLEGKFKLGQERGDADRESIVKHLESARRDRSMASLTRDFYRRSKRP